jgi:hypothetical protein
MKSTDGEERGAIFTRPEVVSFILDLAGYTADKPLWKYRLLEPSVGLGDFLSSAIERLLISAARDKIPAAQLSGAIRAVELHRDTFLATRQRILALLRGFGVSDASAVELTDTWIANGDYLLENLPGSFDFVVGNPPYVRQEMIPAALLAEYRRRYTTLYDRADLYVPFIERSLQVLTSGGVLGFICSDRWMKNRYGGPLRLLISQGYTLKYYVDMVGTHAFQSAVIAYPAITVIQRAKMGPSRIAHRPEVTTEALGRLRDQITGPARNFNDVIIEISGVTNDQNPWLLEADAQPSLALVRRLEAEFPTLEEAGCSVGIGVATGADKVFIGPMADLAVEDARKLPLVMTRDLVEGTVHWRGLGVVNPFEENGSLADFARYPRFSAFMKMHGAQLKARHCAQRGNGSWYRTIDRITPSLAGTPKLLIPDIKGAAHIVLEEGLLYPHHNLYFIISREWPLPALQAVLRAGIAHLFVRAYSTKMLGGCLRFQAQYLRRIRLPHWQEVSIKNQQALSTAAANHDTERSLAIVGQIYHLDPAEQQHLTEAK